MHRTLHASKLLLAALAAIVSAAALAAPASAQNLFTNGDFTSGFSGWYQRNTANGVGSPGYVWTFQTNPNLPASPAARYVVGQQVYNIGHQEGVELVQYPNLQAGATYEMAFDWAAVADPQYINGEGGVFQIIVDGQSLAYDAAGIMGAGTKVQRSISVQFVASSSGAHEVGTRITRPFIVDIHSPTQYVDNMSLTRIGGGQSLHLTVSGVCPGRMSFDTTGGTPRALMALIYAHSSGSFVIPSNYTCAGTQLNLSSSGIRILATGFADANGRWVVSVNVNSGACGGAWQSIDTATCEVSH